MSTQNTATASASVAFPFATIAVVVLAIAKVQNLWGLGDLSWVWVFAPWWLSIVAFFGILLIIAVIGGIIFGIVALVDVVKSRKARKRLAKSLTERRSK